jgi:hypothetical protein
MLIAEHALEPPPAQGGSLAHREALVCEGKRSTCKNAPVLGSATAPAHEKQHRLRAFRPFFPSPDRPVRDSVNVPPQGLWYGNPLGFEYVCFNYVVEQLTGRKYDRTATWKDVEESAADLGYTPLTFEPGSCLPSSFPPGTVLIFGGFHTGMVGADGSTLFNYRYKSWNDFSPAALDRYQTAREVRETWRTLPNRTQDQPYLSLAVKIFIPPARSISASASQRQLREIALSRVRAPKPFVPSVEKPFRDSVNKPPEGSLFGDPLGFVYVCFNYVYEQLAGIKSDRRATAKDIEEAAAGLGYTPLTFLPGACLPSSYSPGTVVLFGGFHAGIVGVDGKTVFNYSLRTGLEKYQTVDEIWNCWITRTDGTRCQPYARLALRIFIPRSSANGSIPNV